MKLDKNARTDRIRQAWANVKSRAAKPLDPFEAQLRRGEAEAARADRESEAALNEMLNEQEGLT